MLMAGTTPTIRQIPARVHNGIDVVDGKYQFLVILLLGNERTCTGTLLATNWVLTAAHCRLDSVQYGNITTHPAHITATSNLIKRITHPSYLRIKCSDLSMLLVEDIPLKHFAELSGLDYRTMFGLRAAYLGAGLTTWDWTAPSVIKDYMRPLQRGTGVIVQCDDYDIPALTLGSHLCVLSPCDEQQHVMPADSGGPLIVDGKVIGVAFSLHHSPMISIFTAVSPHLTWILDVMGSNKEIL